MKKKTLQGVAAILYCISLTSCNTIPGELPEVTELHEILEKGDITIDAAEIIELPGPGDAINGFLEEFRTGCLFPDESWNKMDITERLLMNLSAEGGAITRYANHEGQLFRYRVKLYGETGRKEENYYFIDDFIYYTELLEEYDMPLSGVVAKQSWTEGIITNGICHHYESERDIIQLSRVIDSVFTADELNVLYDGAVNAPPDYGSEIMDAEQAMQRYKEFLKSEDMYALTATAEYPRGDRTAVYTFGDCNDDGIPELHIAGGGAYHIYTFRGDEIVLFQRFEYYVQLIPMKDGGFLGATRTDRDNTYSVSLRPDFDQSDFSIEPYYSASHKQYSYFKLDSNGNEIKTQSYALSIDIPISKPEGIKYKLDGIECSKEEWESLLLSYRTIWEDDSQHLVWEYIFPEEEWYYLDSMEAGNGPAYGDDSKEWQIYQQILSGNFDSLKSLDDQSCLVSQYQRSLDENTGRSCWKYILMDFDNDGIKELFIRYYPKVDDYLSVDFNHASSVIACFSYRNGAVSWWYIELSKERYVPLSDGQILFLSYYYNSLEMQVGRVDENFDFMPVQEYEQLTVKYGEDYYGDPEWYDTYYFGENNWNCCEFRDIEYAYPEQLVPEGEYYFVRVYDDGSVYGRLKELSIQEWNGVKAELGALLIPDSEWNPVSVFMPSREPKEFHMG